MKEKRAMTVLGPVAADELGTTLTHEHLLFDQIDYVRGPVDAEAARYDDARGGDAPPGGFEAQAGSDP